MLLLLECGLVIWWDEERNGYFFKVILLIEISRWWGLNFWFFSLVILVSFYDLIFGYVIRE